MLTTRLKHTHYFFCSLIGVVDMFKYILCDKIIKRIIVKC